MSGKLLKNSITEHNDHDYHLQRITVTEKKSKDKGVLHCCHLLLHSIFAPFCEKMVVLRNKKWCFVHALTHSFTDKTLQKYCLILESHCWANVKIRIKGKKYSVQNKKTTKAHVKNLLPKKISRNTCSNDYTVVWKLRRCRWVTLGKAPVSIKLLRDALK